MKKVISILLLTFMCAMFFVGCGSESKGATEPYSVAKFNMLHDSTLPLDCSGDVLKDKGYKFTNNSGDDTYNTSLNNIQVGDIVLSGDAQFVLDNTNTVFYAIYNYTNSAPSTIHQLSEIYGEYSRLGDSYEWTVTLPDEREWVIAAFDYSDSSTLSDVKMLYLYDKQKYDAWMDEYYKEEANKLTSQQKAIIKQAVEVADSYLDFELEQKDAESRLETLNERYENLADEDDIFGFDISSLWFDIMMDKNNDHDQDIIETRNFLASIVGMSER